MLLSTKVLRVKPIRVIDRSPWLFLRNLKLGGVLLLSSALLVGCGSNPTGSVADSNANLSSSLIMEKAATIPVLDGKVTQAGVYIHNNTGKSISGIRYSSVALEYHAGSQIEINSLTDCSTIAANSSCLLSLSAPALTVGQSGSTLIDASYDGEHSKQLINYRYYASKDYTGVNFSDASTSLYGTNDYATVYAFVGQSQAQDNVAFDVNNSSLGVSGGLTNGKVNIGVNQVIPLEIHSNQNVISNLVTVTPYTATTSKQLVQALQRAQQTNQALQVSISPTQQANLLMSDAPVLTQSESNAILTVVNNGNQSATSIVLSSTDNSKVSVTTASINPCTNNATLAAGASCNYKINLIDKSSNSSVVLTLDYNNSIVATQTSQTVYLQNNNAAPMVSVVATQSSFTEQVNTNQNLTFNIRNTGNAPLNNVVITPKKTLTNTMLAIQNNTCTTTLAANSSCQVQLNVQASSLIDSGIIYLNVSGDNANATQTSYSFMSKVISATITDSTNPTVPSTTPQDTDTGISIATSITVNFSEAMDPTTLNTSNIQLQKLSDSSVIATTLQSVTGNNQTATFVLNGVTLAGTTKYKIVINPSQIKDANGNAMNSGLTTDTVATFTTTTVDNIAPTISNFTPGSGEPPQSKTPSITLSFSEAMNQATLIPSNIILKTQAGVAVTGYTISYNPSNFIATLNLNGTELASTTTYQMIVIQPNITDTTGNSLGNDANYLVTSFNTADFIAPTLVNGSTVPVNGANNVSVNTPISLTFSEAMKTSSLNINTIMLQKVSDGSNVTLGSPSFSNSNKTVTFQPTTSLLAGASYNVVINPSAIMDVSGNAVDASSNSRTVTNFTVAPLASPLTYTQVGGAQVGCSGTVGAGDVFGLTQVGSNLVATKKVAGCGYSNVAIVTSTSSVWSSYGTGAGTPIRLAFDLNVTGMLIVSRTNGNVVLMNPGAGGGSSITSKFGSADVLGLVYNPGDYLVYAFQSTRSPTTGGSHAVASGTATPWNDINYSPDTRSLYLRGGTVSQSFCYGSGFNAGNIFEGGCSTDSAGTTMFKNYTALSGLAPAAIRSLLITNDGQYMFVGCADGNVYLVSGWK